MEKKVVAFLKALEKSRLIVKGSHKSPVIIKNVMEIIQMPEEEAMHCGNATIQFFYGEYTDWVETYVEA